MVGQRLNPEQLGRFLRVLMVLVLCAIPLSLGWALVWPLHGEPVNKHTTSHPPQKDLAMANTTEEAIEKELGTVLTRKLRHELDAGKTNSLRRSVRKVPLPAGLELLVTLVETDHRAALFSLTTGELRWCRVGDTIDHGSSLEVVAIEPATVVLRSAGQESILKIRYAGEG